MIPYFTGIPEDVCMNVMHFEFTGIAGIPAPADITNLLAYVVAFYGDIYEASTTMANYAVPANTRIKVFNLDDPTPRVPVFDEIVPITTGARSNATLPLEAAIVASIYASPCRGSHSDPNAAGSTSDASAPAWWRSGARRASLACRRPSGRTSMMPLWPCRRVSSRRTGCG